MFWITGSQTNGCRYRSTAGCSNKRLSRLASAQYSPNVVITQREFAIDFVMSRTTVITVITTQIIPKNLIVSLITCSFDPVKQLVFKVAPSSYRAFLHFAKSVGPAFKIFFPAVFRFMVLWYTVLDTLPLIKLCGVSFRGVIALGIMFNLLDKHSHMSILRTLGRSNLFAIDIVAAPDNTIVQGKLFP